MNEKYSTVIPIGTSIAVVAPRALYTGMKPDSDGKNEAQGIAIASLTSYQHGKIRTAEVIVLNATETPEETEKLKRLIVNIATGIKRGMKTHKSEGSKFKVKNEGLKLKINFDAGIYH